MEMSKRQDTAERLGNSTYERLRNMILQGELPTGTAFRKNVFQKVCPYPEPP